jgi:hypothetical protein
MEAGLVQVSANLNAHTNELINHLSVAQQGAADRHTRLLPTEDGSAR